MKWPKEDILVPELLGPVVAATAALARLDERVARSPVGKGWIERTHFADACASLWLDGKLVHLEDLVLHDAGSDIHTPTHELAIARDVLRTRRRIAAQPAAWALSTDGLSALCGPGVAVADALDVVPAAAEAGARDDGSTGPLETELAAIDAVLARTAAVLSGAVRPRSGLRAGRNPLVHDPDWDEEERLAQWRAGLADTQDLPPVLRAVLLLDAWNTAGVLQHAPWLGRLLAAERLREAGLTTGAHLAAFNAGLRGIAWERRASRRRQIRLLALLDGLAAAAEAGLKEHDRLLLARQMMERRLVGRRRSSKLPELVELVLARPMVSAGMVARILAVTPRTALRILGELNLREITGRGRFRAWGIV